jgi:RNA polymerase sigma factor (sigma-70 family)
MAHSGKFVLLDESGNPLAARIEGVLNDLAPRLCRQFPLLTKDEVVLVDILEEAGRRLLDRERRSGPIEKLHGYAWVTVRSVAAARMRRGPMRLERATLEADDDGTVLSSLASEVGSEEAIERGILLKQVLASLSAEERVLCMWKRAGLSSREIAGRLGTSPHAADMLFYRIKEKIRAALGAVKSRPPPDATRKDRK